MPPSACCPRRCDAAACECLRSSVTAVQGSNTANLRSCHVQNSQGSAFSSTGSKRGKGGWR